MEVPGWDKGESIETTSRFSAFQGKKLEKVERVRRCDQEHEVQSTHRALMSNPMITLVGEELNAICYKWSTCLAAPNASIYGIPYNAGRAVKFNPVDKSMTEIGPNFGDGQAKWEGGAITDNGVIYCPPSDGGRGVLKIDTNTDDVTELDIVRLPEQGRGTKWKSLDVSSNLASTSPMTRTLIEQ